MKKGVMMGVLMAISTFIFSQSRYNEWHPGTHVVSKESGVVKAGVVRHFADWMSHKIDVRKRVGW